MPQAARLPRQPHPAQPAVRPAGTVQAAVATSVGGPERAGTAGPLGTRPDRATPRPGVRLAPAPAVEADWPRVYARFLVGADLAAGAVGAAVAYLVRFGAGRDGGPYRREHLVLSLGLPVAWVFVIGLSRAYEARFLATGSEEFKRVFNAAVRVTAVVGLIALATHIELARRYVVVALPLATLLSLGARLLLRRVLSRLRAAGRCVHRAVVVGDPGVVLHLIDQIRHHRDTGLQIVGACTPSGRGSPGLVRADVSVVGAIDDVPAAVRMLRADTVAVAASGDLDARALRRLAWQLEGFNVHLLVSPALTDIAGSRIHIRPVCGLPLLHVEEPELSGGRQLAKTMVDRILAGLALLTMSPGLLVLALLVKLTSPGPVLFRQQRVGRGGRHFTMLKFRSMYADAEQRLAEVAGRNERAEGLLFKMRDDPRVTPLGRRLRRFSVDELPQLVNVLRGDMSLVGPRPPLPAEVARYDADVRRRLLVRPGLTGLWQVSGRSDLAWEESVKLDLHYVENWSLALDIQILSRTLSAVVGRRGAY